MILERITYECSRCDFSHGWKFKAVEHDAENPLCAESDCDGLTPSELDAHMAYLRSLYGEDLRNYDGAF